MLSWLACLAGATLLASQSAALAQSCATAINEFREIVKTETSMGHVSGGNQSAALAELARVEQICRAALQALQRRMKFR